MKMLSAEEKTSYFYWFVLEKIWEQLQLSNNKNSSITYQLFVYPALSDSYIPNSTIEQTIIQGLIKDKVLKVVEKSKDFQIGGSISKNPKSAGVLFYFKVDRVRFEKLHKKYKQKIELYETAESEGNTLYLNENGETKYVASDGKEYVAKFNTSKNGYKLLRFFADKPNQLFSFSDLAVNLNPPRKHDKGSTDERRVRDTIKTIKKEIKYKGDDFILSDYGFKLMCKVHIVK